MVTLNIDGRQIDVGPSAYDALRVGCFHLVSQFIMLRTSDIR